MQESQYRDLQQNFKPLPNQASIPFLTNESQYRDLQQKYTTVQIQLETLSNYLITHLLRGHEVLTHPRHLASAAYTTLQPGQKTAHSQSLNKKIPEYFKNNFKMGSCHGIQVRSVEN